MPAGLAVVLLLASCSAGSTATLPATAETLAQSTAAEIPTPNDLLLRALVRAMSLDELAGQMLMISLEGQSSSEALALVGEIRPGGIILFGSDIQTVTQVQDLVERLQDAAVVPLIIATDQEGGLVSRLTASAQLGATVMPSATLVGIAAAELDRRGEPESGSDLARRWGQAIGEELRSLGITMDLGPVADVNDPERNGLLAEQRRTFGSDPGLVAALTAAAVHGLHAAGVAAVLKHFPGQGSAELDSHTARVSLDISRERLRAVDLVPFAAGIAAGAEVVMSAHISYPVATGDSLPATVSPTLLSDVLRTELGFTGVTMTDALNMEALARSSAGAPLELGAIRAGADMLLEPDDPAAVRSALVRAVNAGILSRNRLEESAMRILQLKLHTGLFGPQVEWTDPGASDVLGSQAHLRLVNEIRAVARSRRQ